MEHVKILLDISKDSPDHVLPEPSQRRANLAGSMLWSDGWDWWCGGWQVQRIFGDDRDYLYVSRKADEHGPAYTEQQFRLRDGDEHGTLVLEHDRGTAKATLRRQDWSAYLYHKYGIDKIHVRDPRGYFACAKYEAGQHQQLITDILSDGQVHIKSLHHCGRLSTPFEVQVSGEATWALLAGEDDSREVITLLSHVELNAALRAYLAEHDCYSIGVAIGKQIYGNFPEAQTVGITN